MGASRIGPPPPGIVATTPSRTGYVVVAVIGILPPRIWLMIGVRMSKLHGMTISAGSPMSKPAGKAGSGTWTLPATLGSSQLIAAASLATRSW